MILQKVTIRQPNRNATSVDDFYYRGYEQQLDGRKGTGVRKLAADMIREGKILDRYLILRDGGCVLEIYTLFVNRDALNEFTDHPIRKTSREFWQDREWDMSMDIVNVQEFMSVKSRIESLK
jgi:hypothetical protein